MCVQTEVDQLNDHHDEFGTFVRHSCLRAKRILAMGLWRYLLQTAGIWHDQLDQNFSKRARTIEPKNKFYLYKKF